MRISKKVKWYGLIVGLLVIVSLGAFLLACQAKPADAHFQQWERSGHANRELAVVEAAVENRGATAAHCGRCHSEQGFLAWTKQGDLTKQIQGAKGNATVDELKALGLNKDQVQSQTCATCHSEGSATRITGETAVLPAGFQAKVVGKGALCMTCHNTRNLLHNIDAPPTLFRSPYCRPG